MLTLIFHLLNLKVSECRLDLNLALDSFGKSNIGPCPKECIEVTQWYCCFMFDCYDSVIFIKKMSLLPRIFEYSLFDFK